MCCSSSCCHALTPHEIKCRCGNSCARCRDCDECGGDDDVYGVADILIQAALDKLSNSIVKVGPNVPSPAESSEDESEDEDEDEKDKQSKDTGLSPSTTMSSLSSFASGNSGSSSSSGVSSGSGSSGTSSGSDRSGRRKGGTLRHLLPRSESEEEKPGQMMGLLGAANEGCAQQ